MLRKSSALLPVRSFVALLPLRRHSLPCLGRSTDRPAIGRRRSMEHKHLDQLRSVADVQPKPLPRQERLERWIALLERDPSRRLNSLGEIEYKPPAERALIREDNSPLTVAYEDPIFRA